MAHTRRFNRHENMNGVTRAVILHLIQVNVGGNWEITNMLYGLFDGYDYADAIKEEVENTTKGDFINWSEQDFKFLDAVCNEVKKYPEGVTAV
jgi:hypothetical protein